VILPTYHWIRTELATQLPGMRPADVVASSASPTWCLAGPAGPWLVYALEGGRFSLNIPAPTGKSAAIWFDPRTGSQQEAIPSDEAEALTFEAPSSEDWALYVPAPR
jgi:hypothetical protein